MMNRVNDLISRQNAIDAFMVEHPDGKDSMRISWALHVLDELPSVQPTLYGYNIEHLVLIAKLLEKENLSPEEVSDALYDIGRIIAIVKKEFEETMKKTVELCIN